MTDIYFDTDCLSSFLWVREQNLLISHFGSISIAEEVYSELSHPSVSHLKTRTDKLLQLNALTIETINYGTPEWNLYLEMTRGEGLKIGRGEAATIALAKCLNGTVASNNLKDVCFYIKKFSLINKTTADILYDMFAKGVITEAKGSVIWKDLMKKRKKSMPKGIQTFSDYLKLRQTPSS
ncbi:hypothetical protein MmiAt1_09800 [Methanimicrococcus sp. At1]|uniref:PIN domain-containing protein n=1 Tax=Methanimicrococcus hacksteinii TaxID=3028293 RepID=A0ABU3VPS6_9EURY|nr:hypothetical protein [Methanimicrococcus sp. At1]MDV0445403.1 hypothetical protein [Methanimicrococcus sp. At1]